MLLSCIEFLFLKVEINPDPGNELRNQIYLGDEGFIDEMQCKISPDTNLSEIASSQKRQVPKSLDYYDNKTKIEIRQ